MDGVRKLGWLPTTIRDWEQSASSARSLNSWDPISDTADMKQTAVVRPIKTRGKPFEPGNQYGKGRPPGSPNKKSLVLQQLLFDHSEQIIADLIKDAKKGDPTALKLCVERLIPALRTVEEQPVEQAANQPRKIRINFV